MRTTPRSQALLEWRNRNRDKFEKQKARNYERGAMHQWSAGKEWTSSENRRITEPGRPHDRELAAELGRTVRAIQIQRCDLRKLV